MRESIAVLAIVSLAEYVASSAYDSGKKTWDKAEVVKELSKTDKKSPSPSKDYNDVTFNFKVDESKIKATTPLPNGLLYKLEITDVNFDLHGSLPEDVKKQLSGNSGGSATPGKNTILPDCTFRSKEKFEDVGMKGTLKLAISRPKTGGDQAQSECACSGAAVDSTVRGIWKTQCKLGDTMITTHACAAMIPVCKALLSANGQNPK